MIIKVCGMRHADNIREVEALGVDWIGMIFYPLSPRYYGKDKRDADGLTGRARRVGVFVNASPEEVLETALNHHLDYVQLHGDESPDYCYALQKRGLSLIKSFSIADEKDIEQTAEYEGRVNYFLFDTKCTGYGGSGQSFDWSLLSHYTGQTPFLLSGGINPESIEAFRQFRHPRCVGLDLNSGFEIEPGLKSVERLQQFFSDLQTIKNKTMNRITTLFNTKKNGILSVYFTAGYPQLNDTLPVLRALQAKSIDLVEVGIPFSDPMADGPVIQESSTQALRNGMSLKLLFEQLKDVRKEIHIPLILMGYLNPIMQYGFEQFCRDCVTTGIDGVIIPDLPFSDYMSDYKVLAEQYNLKMIMLITPETSEERIHLIDRHTNGFIYMVSSAATTGAQKDFDEQKQVYFRRINSMNLQNPRLIGFGISNKATFDTALSNASGAIVGSRFIQMLQTEDTIEGAAKRLTCELYDDCD